jgi:hypothetical protein
MQIFASQTKDIRRKTMDPEDEMDASSAVEERRFSAASARQKRMGFSP